MAKYENIGHRPSRSFYNYPVACRNPQYYEIMDRLASRQTIMIYSTNEVAFYGFSYIVDAMCGGIDGNLGIQITNLLVELIPNFRYPDTTRKIEVRDCINPYLMGNENSCIRFSGNTFYLVCRRSSKDQVLLQDERYVVLIREDLFKNIIYIDLFKKEPYKF